MKEYEEICHPKQIEVNGIKHGIPVMEEGHIKKQWKTYIMERKTHFWIVVGMKIRYLFDIRR